MEKEKRQRISLPQMVVSGEGSDARVKVKVEVAGGAGGAAEGASAVGRMVDSSQADDRKLIRLVRERRLLYARNNMPVASYYTQVKNLWDDVATIMGWSVADVRRKWSHIRNSYSRHLRNEMHGACTSKGRMVSRWYLADELEFLREHMATDIRLAAGWRAKKIKPGEESSSHVMRRNEWLKAVGREDLLTKCDEDKKRLQYRICEDHFDKSCIKYSKNKTTKYLFDNAFPTLNLPTNDRACPSSSKCENENALYIPGNQNIRVILEPTAEISSGSNNHFNKIDQTRDQTSCSIQTDPYKEPCENKSTQTALHLSADTPIKRKLLLELREEKTRKSRSSPYSSYAPTLLEMDLNESSSSEQVDIKPFIHNPWFALNATPSPALDPKPPAIQNEDSSSSNAFTADENSSYFQFFRAIHSEFLELSPKKQRQFKRKCLVYLHELLDEEDNSHKRHGYSHQDNVLNLSNSGHMSEEEKDVKPVVEDGCIISSN